VEDEASVAHVSGYLREENKRGSSDIDKSLSKSNAIKKEGQEEFDTIQKINYQCNPLAQAHYSLFYDFLSSVLGYNFGESPATRRFEP
jgi:hypothetical protein